MKSFNLNRAIGAGFIGTLSMTAIMMLAPVMGMPKMDIAAMLGSMLAGEPPAVGSSAWLAGLGMHLMIGIVVLSTGYALIRKHLPTSGRVRKGLVYGTVVWLVAQSIVMPMMGAGLFSSHLPQGMMMAAGSLVGHSIYGGVVGWFYDRYSEAELGHFSTLGL